MTERIGAAQLGGRRDDVGEAFPAYANARHVGLLAVQRYRSPRRISDLSMVACRRSV